MTKILLAIAFLLVLIGVAPVMVPAGSPAPTPAFTPAAMVPMPPARCPRIHEAAEALESAIQDMQSAAHDFCGHRREAMEAAHHALQELRRAENCDRCR